MQHEMQALRNYYSPLELTTIVIRKEKLSRNTLVNNYPEILPRLLYGFFLPYVDYYIFPVDFESKCSGKHG